MLSTKIFHNSKNCLLNCTKFSSKVFETSTIQSYFHTQSKFTENNSSNNNQVLNTSTKTERNEDNKNSSNSHKKTWEEARKAVNDNVTLFRNMTFITSIIASTIYGLKNFDKIKEQIKDFYDFSKLKPEFYHFRKIRSEYGLFEGYPSLARHEGDIANNVSNCKHDYFALSGGSGQYITSGVIFKSIETALKYGKKIKIILIDPDIYDPIQQKYIIQDTEKTIKFILDYNRDNPPEKIEVRLLPQKEIFSLEIMDGYIGTQDSSTLTEKDEFKNSILRITHKPFEKGTKEYQKKMFIYGFKNDKDYKNDNSGYKLYRVIANELWKNSKPIEEYIRDKERK